MPLGTFKRPALRPRARVRASARRARDNNLAGCTGRGRRHRASPKSLGSAGVQFGAREAEGERGKQDYPGRPEYIDNDE